VPTFEPGAVGSHVIEVQRLVREDLGLASEVFAEHVRGPGGARRHTDYGRAVPARPGDVLVYQMAIGSVVADFVAARPETLVVNSHNITPARFLQPWDPGVTHGVAWGQDQLRQLAGRAALGVAVSSFNRADLVAAGFARTAVVPVLVDVGRASGDSDPAVEDRLRATKGGTDWLFVGRISPNKCQHDVVRAFAAYRRLYDGAARLWLVGSPASASYQDALERMVDDLGLGPAVTFTGSLSQAAVVAHYRAADVFVCLSEHEGFCVPLLEAWWHRLPVVAFAAAAVPETLDDAGLLLADKGPARVAASVARVASDEPLRRALVARGSDRLDEFSLPRTRARLAEVLKPLLAGAAP